MHQKNEMRVNSKAKVWIKRGINKGHGVDALRMRLTGWHALSRLS